MIQSTFLGHIVEISDMVGGLLAFFILLVPALNQAFCFSDNQQIYEFEEVGAKRFIILRGYATVAHTDGFSKTFVGIMIFASVG